MRRKVRVEFEGATRDAFEEDFETVREEWNEYRLLDGGSVRVKAVPHKMVRVLDDSGGFMRTPDGDPVVLVRAAVMVVASD